LIQKKNFEHRVPEI